MDIIQNNTLNKKKINFNTKKLEKINQKKKKNV